MRRSISAALLCCLIALTACGCTALTGSGRDEPEHASVRRDSLQVDVSVDRHTATVGENIHLTVVARNLSRSAIPIASATTEPVIVTVWRYDRPKGWVRVRQFPAASYRQYTQWLLGAKDQRTFVFDLPVTPDWPQLTILKLSAELNGRPDARPHEFVTVQPK